MILTSKFSGGRASSLFEGCFCITLISDKYKTTLKGKDIVRCKTALPTGKL